RRLATTLAPCDGPFHVRVIGLPALARLRAPQSAHREDDGEERGNAERDERPDEEEGFAGLGDLAADNASSPPEVDDGDASPRSDPRRMMTYPDRRSASTSVPYSQVTRMGTAMRFESPPFSIPRTMSSAR